MGTRGAYGFIVDGKEKVSYNHMDSYPSFLCNGLLKELSALSDLNILTENVRNIVMVEQEDTPNISDKELSLLSEFTNNNVGSGGVWYNILRESQGTIEPYCRQENPLRYMTDAKGFLYDSLFCEYAYIINLDTNMVEFYRGFNRHQDAPGRYAYPPALKDDKNAVVTDDYSGGCNGVALVGEAPIEAFLNATEEQIDEFTTRLEDFMSEYDYQNVKTFQLENLS